MRSNLKQQCNITPSTKIIKKKKKKKEEKRKEKKKKKKKEKTLSTQCEIRGMQQNITVFY